MNMIKKTLFAFLFIQLCGSALAQNGFVILTEETTLSAPYISKVHISLPNGTSTTTTITSDQIDVAQHDQQLNVLINGITNQGYKHIEAPYGTSRTVSGTTTARWVMRLFFGYP